MPDGQALRLGAGAVVYWAPADPGGDYASPAPVVCPACVGGWHGPHCQETFWPADDPNPTAPVDCECTIDACPGEWQEVGYTEPDPIPSVGFQVLKAHVDADGVRHITQVVEFTADKPPYVKSRHAGGAQHAEQRPAVPSGAMTRSPEPYMDLIEAEAIAGGILLPRRRDAPTINQADVERHRRIPELGPVSIAGAEGDEKDDVRIKANRTDYRRAGMRRRGRRR